MTIRPDSALVPVKKEHPSITLPPYQKIERGDIVDIRFPIQDDRQTGTYEVLLITSLSSSKCPVYWISNSKHPCTMCKERSWMTLSKKTESDWCYLPHNLNFDSVLSASMAGKFFDNYLTTLTLLLLTMTTALDTKRGLDSGIDRQKTGGFSLALGRKIRLISRRTTTAQTSAKTSKAYCYRGVPYERG